MQRLRSGLWFLTGLGLATVVIPPAGFWTVWAAVGTAGSASLLGYSQYIDDSLRVTGMLTTTESDSLEGYFTLNDELVLFTAKGEGATKEWLQGRVKKRVRLVIEEVEQ